jgi:hypothetical protein
MMRWLKIIMLTTDLGFIAYWTITIAHLIPPESLFNDYANPIMVHWNWSFLPLDLLISATGLTSLILMHRHMTIWRQFAIISLVLTFVSGLQAIAFWAIAHDFNLSWWIPNLFLLLYPLFFLPRLIMHANISLGKTEVSESR